MVFKIEIDQDACIGCGACVATCPDCYDMDGDKAKAKKAEVKDAGCAQEGADGCPVSCIKITKF